MKPQTEKAESTFSAEALAARTVHRRAVEAVNWGIPAVNLRPMFKRWSATPRAPSIRLSIGQGLRLEEPDLTPNPDAIYLMPFFNTKDVGPSGAGDSSADEGSITGTIMDCWQIALEDVGPAGVDKGKGGKYLILPPALQRQDARWYIPLPSITYQGYALLRSILKSTQRSGCRQSGRVRQTNHALPAFRSRESTGDNVRGRDRRRVRWHYSLRRSLLPVARPHGAGRAVAGARPGDDRHAQVNRHRERQAVQAGRTKTTDILNVGRPGSARLVRYAIRNDVIEPLTRHALVSSGREGSA